MIGEERSVSSIAVSGRVLRRDDPAHRTGTTVCGPSSSGLPGASVG